MLAEVEPCAISSLMRRSNCSETSETMTTDDPRPFFPADPYPVRSPIIVSVLSRSLDPFPGEALIRRSLETLLGGLKDEFGDAVRLMVGGGGAGDSLAALAAGNVGVPRIEVVGNNTRSASTVMPMAELRIDLGHDHGESCNEVDRVCAPWSAIVNALISSAHIIVTLGNECPLQIAGSLAGTAWTSDNFPYQQGDDSAPRTRAAEVAAALDITTPVPWLQVSGEKVWFSSQYDSSACVRHRRGAGPEYMELRQRHKILELLPERTREALWSIKKLNTHITSIRHRIDQVNRRDQWEAISVTKVPQTPLAHDVPLGRLRDLQAGVDTIARGFQRWILGVGTPSLGIRDRLGQMNNNRKNGGWTLSVSVLFSFCLLVPLILTIFELYAHPPHFLPFYKNSHHLLIAYILLFISSFGSYFFIVKPKKWQDQFQDYRVYAEALRVQVFWSLAGLHHQVGDHYLYKHRAELGWIRYALRGVLPWARAVSSGVPAPQRAVIQAGWIADQKAYFARAAARNHHSSRRSRNCVYGFLWIGVAVATLLLIAEVSVNGLFGLPAFLGKDKLLSLSSLLGFSAQGVKDLKYLAIITMGVMPALAAFFGISSEMRAFEGHAQGYDLMNQIFSRAMDAEAKVAVDDDAFRRLVFELGREAINENAGWLMDHRHRPIENRMG